MGRGGKSIVASVNLERRFKGIKKILRIWPKLLYEVFIHKNKMYTKLIKQQSIKIFSQIL